MKYDLRLGGWDDFDALFDIYMDVKTNPYLSFEIMGKEAFKPIFEELLQRGQLYVYTNEQDILATCIVIHHIRRIKHVATLSTLATHPNYKRQGFGSTFIKQLIQKIKSQSIKRVELFLESDNPGALAFYKKLGFEQEGVMKKYFKRARDDHYVDEIIMGMWLGN